MSFDVLLQTNAPGLDYPTIRPTLNLNFAKTKTLDPRITFTRNSIGTYVGSDGYIKTAVANEPRFDYDPTTGKCLGLLLEESRTNLALWSENFNSSPWFSDYARISNVVSSPDGSITGTEVRFGYYSSLTQPISFNSLVRVTLSGWIKKVPGYDYTPTGADLSSGGKFLRFTASKGANQKTSVISGTDISETWKRYSWTVLIDEIGNWDIGFLCSNPSGYYFYLWGFQCEVGTYATSYIPTSGSTITRDVDSVSITGTNFSSWYNSTEGTLLSIGEENSHKISSNTLTINSNSSSKDVVSNILYYPKTIQYPTLKTMNAYPSQVTDGLVLQLDAGLKKSYPGATAIWTDLSGLGNNGTLTNGPTYSSANGGSIVFDGVDDAVTFTYSSSLNIGGLNITLSAWIRPTSLVNLNAGGGIIVRENGQNNDGLYEMILLQNSGKNWLFFRMFNIGTYNPKIIPIELNTYYNIVCVYNNGIMRNYINGVEEGSGVVRNINITTDNTKLIRVGQRPVDLASAFPGNIAQTLIYNRALTAAEVQQNFNALRGRFDL